MVRLLTWGKYNIPVTPEEGAKFEAAIAAWLEANGSLYGFITSFLG
jgi:LAS superfamily LD-carboxypeptidase LdcB